MNFEEKIKIISYNVRKELENVGIPISNNIDIIKINKRAKTRLGACKLTIYNSERHFTIEIGSALKNCNENIIKEIIAHELIHTCPGCMNHGLKWKSYAEKVNKIYGYNIKRTISLIELGLNPNKIGEKRKQVYKYEIKCDKCGRKVYRIRKSRVIQYPNKYKCTCGGSIKVKKINEKEKVRYDY